MIALLESTKIKIRLMTPSASLVQQGSLQRAGRPLVNHVKKENFRSSKQRPTTSASFVTSASCSLLFPQRVTTVILESFKNLAARGPLRATFAQQERNLPTRPRPVPIVIPESISRRMPKHRRHASTVLLVSRLTPCRPCAWSV